MLTRLTVPLDRDERQALTQLAEREGRDPRRQVAYIVRRYLEEIEFLPRKVTLPIEKPEARHEQPA
jgi:sulfite reductase beta subunit-like hemoprotein